MTSGTTHRLRFLLSLAFVGVGAAAFAIVFRSLLALVYQHVYGHANVVDAIRGLPSWLRIVVPILGATIAGSVARLRRAPAQGVSNVMEAVALGNVQLSFRTTLSRVAASLVALASGLSIGREGPLIEFGGALGALSGRLMGTSATAVRVLVAAGTAAGFAAAYNTPFAAVLFVVETLAGIAVPQMLLATIAATVIATALTRAVVGGGPIYGQRALGLHSPTGLLACAVLGIFAAVTAGLFKRLLRWLEEHLERRPISQPARAMLGGAVVGIIATWVPDVAGNGYEPLNAILNGDLVWSAAIVVGLAKILATSGAVASGIPGGIFTAMLLVGGALGTVWGHVLGFTGDAAVVSVGSLALVGMAATTAASIHAPLTAAVLVFELSGDYLVVLPLLLATVVATTLSRALGSESVYETELRRRGLGWELTLEGRRVRDD